MCSVESIGCGLDDGGAGSDRSEPAENNVHSEIVRTFLAVCVACNGGTRRRVPPHSGGGVCSPCNRTEDEDDWGWLRPVKVS